MGETNSTNIPARLRAVAELIEAHPDLPAPMVTGYSSGRVEVDWFVNHDNQQRDTMLAIRRGIGGTWHKAPSETYYLLRRDYAGAVLTIYADREQVCERVVVGTETVTIPAQPAVEAQPERTEVREVVEWRCEPVIVEAVGA